MFDSPVIPMTVFFLSFAAIFVLRGPFGRALAERMLRRGGTEDRVVQELRAEVDELRRRLAEVEERVDFAERQLVRGPGERALKAGM